MHVHLVSILQHIGLPGCKQLIVDIPSPTISLPSRCAAHTPYMSASRLPHTRQYEAMNVLGLAFPTEHEGGGLASLMHAHRDCWRPWLQATLMSTLRFLSCC